jgi:hypothetical protein
LTWFREVETALESPFHPSTAKIEGCDFVHEKVQAWNVFVLLEIGKNVLTIVSHASRSVTEASSFHPDVSV